MSQLNSGGHQDPALLLSARAAGFLPARRAATIDPLKARRSE
jgi:hypothetical protein